MTDKLFGICIVGNDVRNYHPDFTDIAPYVVLHTEQDKTDWKVIDQHLQDWLKTLDEKPTSEEGGEPAEEFLAYLEQFGYQSPLIPSGIHEIDIFFDNEEE